ncbi:MAG: DNA polymerase [Candidatus Bilamarchaeaceae archaeon]
MIALDTETTGLYIFHGCKPFLVSTCDESGNLRCWEWEVDPLTREPRITKQELQDLQDYLDGQDHIVLHNAKFDLHGLERIGIYIPWSKVQDTLVASHIFESSGSHGLKELALVHLGIPEDDVRRLEGSVLVARRIALQKGWAICSDDHPHFKPACGRIPSKWMMDLWIPRQLYLTDKTIRRSYPEWEKVCRDYAELDAQRTMLLWQMFSDAMTEYSPNKDLLPKGWMRKQYRFRMRTLGILFEMERRGVTINLDRTVKLQAKLSALASDHEASASRIGRKHLRSETFNVRSHKQMAELLYGRWKLPILTRTKGGLPACDIQTLMRLGFGEEKITVRKDTVRFIADVVVYSKFNKAGEYLEKYIAAVSERTRSGYGVIRPTFNLTGTDTTRLSSSNPNGQNISRGGITVQGENELLADLANNETSLRSIFGPPPGYVWYSIDFSQLQIRIFAYVSNEASLIKALADGWDAHDYMAHRLFKLPESESPTKLQRRVAKAVNFGFIFGASPQKIDSVGGSGVYEEVMRMFPNAHKFMDKTKAFVKRFGYVVTPGGYKLTCDKPHAGVNYIVQGAEGEIVQRAMQLSTNLISTNRDNPLKPYHQEAVHTHLILQVHDELVFSAKAPAEGQILEKPTIKEFPLLSAICSEMERAGEYYGMRTPVEPEIVTDRWDKGCKVERIS